MFASAHVLQALWTCWWTAPSLASGTSWCYTEVPEESLGQESKQKECSKIVTDQFGGSWHERVREPIVRAPKVQLSSAGLIRNKYCTVIGIFNKQYLILFNTVCSYHWMYKIILFPSRVRFIHCKTLKYLNSNWKKTAISGYIMLDIKITAYLGFGICVTLLRKTLFVQHLLYKL